MQKFFRNILLMMIYFMIAFEYFVFIWFWAGADVFNLLVTPLCFIFYLLIFIYIKKKLRGYKISIFVINNAIAVIVPLLSAVSVIVIAKIFGINIIIQ